MLVLREMAIEVPTKIISGAVSTSISSKTIAICAKNNNRNSQASMLDDLSSLLIGISNL